MFTAERPSVRSDKNMVVKVIVAKGTVHFSEECITLRRIRFFFSTRTIDFIFEIGIRPSDIVTVPTRAISVDDSLNTEIRDNDNGLKSNKTLLFGGYFEQENDIEPVQTAVEK